MSASFRARVVAGVAAWAAPVLLCAPAVAVATAATQWEWTWWRGGGNAEQYELPRVVTALGALAAASILPFRRTRSYGVALGIVAVLAACSHPLASTVSEWLRWPRFGPFGDDRSILEAAWGAVTLAALLCVPRTSRAPVRRPTRGPTRFIPGGLAVVCGGVLVALAWFKMRSMMRMKCGDPWLDANLSMTTAEAWAGLLVLVPRTRRSGLRFATVLMEGTAVVAVRRWMDGVSSAGCNCFGSIDAPWSFHVAFAAAMAAALGVAYVRELSVRVADVRRAEWLCAGRFRMPALLVRFRTIRRERNLHGGRWRWGRSVAALALCVVFVPAFLAAVNAGLEFAVSPRYPGLGYRALIVALICAAIHAGARRLAGPPGPTLRTVASAWAARVRAPLRSRAAPGPARR